MRRSRWILADGEGVEDEDAGDVVNFYKVLLLTTSISNCYVGRVPECCFGSLTNVICEPIEVLKANAAVWLVQ